MLLQLLIGLQVDDGGLTAMTIPLLLFAFLGFIVSIVEQIDQLLKQVYLRINLFGAVFIGVLLLLCYLSRCNGVFEVVPLEQPITGQFSVYLIPID